MDTVSNGGVSTLGTLKFLNLVGQLKAVKRAGWIRTGVNGPESVADHIHRMSIISMLIPISHPSRDKLVKMAIVHDLAEAIVGDVAPHDGASKEEKCNREDKAMINIRGDMLEGAAIGKEIYSLRQEHAEGSSECAMLCKDIDKFEMTLQASEHEKDQNDRLRLLRESGAVLPVFPERAVVAGERGEGVRRGNGRGVGFVERVFVFELERWESNALGESDNDSDGSF